MSLPRYELHRNSESPFECADGEWVRHDDVCGIAVKLGALLVASEVVLHEATDDDPSLDALIGLRVAVDGVRSLRLPAPDRLARNVYKQRRRLLAAKAHDRAEYLEWVDQQFPKPARGERIGQLRALVERLGGDE